MNESQQKRIEAHAQNYAESQFYYDTDSDKGIAFQSFCAGAEFALKLAAEPEVIMLDEKDFWQRDSESSGV